MKRVLVLALVALGIAACTRVVVLDPAPDSGGGDAIHGNDGGNDAGQDGGSGFLPDAGVVGDAGTLG
jgi:hypothetical protein